MTSKRRLFRDGLVAALTAAALVAAVGAGASSADPIAPTWPEGAPVDAASSDAFAEQVLALAPIPSLASQWTAPPPASLREPMVSVGITGLVDLHELFEVNQLPEPLFSYVLADLPAGAKLTTSGGGGGPQGSFDGFVVTVPTSGPNDYLAQLVYTTTWVGSADVVRVDAQVVWVPNRPAGERIPTQVIATLTGFGVLSLANPPSEPVTVDLDSEQSAHLAGLVNALPLGPESLCMEDTELFSIGFRSQTASGATDDVTGYECGQAVRLTVGGVAKPLLSDAGCSLFDAVRELLPPSATATRGSGC